MGQTFSQGGAFSLTPPKIQKNEQGEVVRINLAYYCSGFKTVPKAVKDKDLEKVLPELEKMNLDRSVIELWFSEKIGDVQQYGMTAYSNEASFILTCLFPCVLIPKLFPASQRKEFERYKNWDDALRKWQADFNKEVLEPKGMFIKSQSKTRAHGGDEQKERWFSIALNNEEATKLKAEEHILGAAYPIGVCVSSGMHEKDFCCHPPTY